MFGKKWFIRYNAEEQGDGGNGDGGDPVIESNTDTPPADPATPPADPAAPPATPPSDPQGEWAPDWRAKISSDTKHLKTLERFASPKAMFESYVALRQKVDSGELRSNTPFPTEGTDEEKTAWRTSHGIPAASDAYEIKLGDGLVMGDADKPFVDDFLKTAHATNMEPEKVNAVLNWYYNRQEAILDEQEERDTAFKQQTEDQLRTEWGGEFRPNINMVKGLVSTMPAALQPLFAGARLANGDALLNHPDMARWLVHISRELNPSATLVPGGGGNIASAVEDEIAAIEKVMRTDRAAYNRDENMQQRLLKLYEAREKHQK